MEEIVFTATSLSAQECNYISDWMFIPFSSFTENITLLNILKTNCHLNQISTLAMKYNSAIATINANKTPIITP